MDSSRRISKQPRTAALVIIFRSSLHNMRKQSSCGKRSAFASTRFSNTSKAIVPPAKSAASGGETKAAPMLKSPPTVSGVHLSSVRPNRVLRYFCHSFSNSLTACLSLASAAAALCCWESLALCERAPIKSLNGSRTSANESRSAWYFSTVSLSTASGITTWATAEAKAPSVSRSRLA